VNINSDPFIAFEFFIAMILAGFVFIFAPIKKIKVLVFWLIVFEFLAIGTLIGALIK
jgi:hypothetical protein